MLALSFLLSCRELNVEQAQPPATPVVLQIQRLDDPTQAAIAYSSKTVYQRGPDVSDGKGIPPDRIAWTLLGLEDRLTRARRYRLTLAMSYENDQDEGYRDYDQATVMPNGPSLVVQPYSRRRGDCGGLGADLCVGSEVVFAWLDEQTLQSVGPGGMTVEVRGRVGRIWQFTVPQALITALFDKMNAAG